MVVTQSCLTLCDPVDGSPPGSSVHGTRQASVVERAALSFSGGWISLAQRANPVSCVSRAAGGFFHRGAPREALRPQSHPRLRPGGIAGCEAREQTRADPQKWTRVSRGPLFTLRRQGEAAAWLQPQQVPCSNASLPRGGEMALFLRCPHIGLSRVTFTWRSSSDSRSP